MMPTTISDLPGDLHLDPRMISRTSALLKYVSDPIRLRIIAHLFDADLSAGALCDILDQDQPTISHHLALLRHGRIVASPRREGAQNFYRLTEVGSEFGRVLIPLLGPERLQTTEVDWARIDEAVQFILDELAESIRLSMPPVRTASGSTSARSFQLFSYRTFDAPEGDEIDAVIVGLLFEQEGDRIAVSADISGESTGMIFHEVPARDVSNDHASVLAAAEEIAADLSSRADVIEAGFAALRRRAIAGRSAER